MQDRSVVYVIDNEPGILREMSALLRSNGYSVRTFGRPDEFRALVKTSAIFGCVILGVNSEDYSGLDLQRQLASDGVASIILFSGYLDVSTAVAAMRAGASEFLLKPVDNIQLLASVDSSLKRAHDAWANCQLARRIQRSYERLTRREREVLPYIVRGFLNKQTAFELGTSEITIRIHRGRIMRKMNASSLAELVWLASCLGIPDRTVELHSLLSA